MLPIIRIILLFTVCFAVCAENFKFDTTDQEDRGPVDVSLLPVAAVPRRLGHTSFYKVSKTVCFLFCLQMTLVSFFSPCSLQVAVKVSWSNKLLPGSSDYFGPAIATLSSVLDRNLIEMMWSVCGSKDQSMHFSYSSDSVPLQRRDCRFYTYTCST